MKKNAFFSVRRRKLWAHVERCLLYYLLKMFSTASFSHMSASEITHTISVFVCLPWVTAHQLQGSVDNDYTSHTRAHIHTFIAPTATQTYAHPSSLCTAGNQVALCTSEQRSIAPILLHIIQHIQNKQCKNLFWCFVYWLWHWKCFS